MLTNTDLFVLDVWRTLQHPEHKGHARRLWAGDPSAAEDGLSDTLCRAITARDKFNGRNLSAWLNRILRNVRRDQLAKGYRKSTERSGSRLVYGYDYNASPAADYCDPESILIAAEQYR